MKEGTLQKIYSSKSKAFLTFCFCFIIGVALASGFDLKREILFYCYLTLLAILFLIIIFWLSKGIRLILVCLLLINLGVVRLLFARPVVNEGHIAYYNNQLVEFTGMVSQEPNVRTGYVNYVLNVRDEFTPQNYFVGFTSHNSLVLRSNSAGLTGQVLVKNQLYPQYNYGDLLRVRCFLKQPENLSGEFKYDKYLARYGVYSLCNYPKIESLSINKGSSLFKNILKLKFFIARRIDQLWPEPRSSFMAGLLYGSRGGLPAELTENFSRTGVTHIIAISGYNISIIVTVMMGLLINLGLYRRQAFWLTLIGIFIFVIFTGASASVTRAGLMGSLVLLAQYLGRMSASGRVMILALVVMLLINPHVLLRDTGLQLSFLATLGLVYLAPVLECGRLSGRLASVRLVGTLLNSLISTMAAIIATLPLILYQFGRLSVVAPLVNLLILWIIPWLMLFGFLAVLLSLFFYPLGQMIAYLAGMGLNYVIIVVNWFGDRQWSAITVAWPNWLMLACYLLMFSIVRKIYGVKSKNFISRGRL